MDVGFRNLPEWLKMPPYYNEVDSSFNVGTYPFFNNFFPTTEKEPVQPKILRITRNMFDGYIFEIKNC